MAKRKPRREYTPIGVDSRTGIYRGQLQRGGHAQGHAAEKFWRKQRFYFRADGGGRGRVVWIRPDKDGKGSQMQSYTVVPDGCPTFDYEDATAIDRKIFNGMPPIRALLQHIDPDSVSRSWLREAGAKEEDLPVPNTAPPAPEPGSVSIPAGAGVTAKEDD